MTANAWTMPSGSCAAGASGPAPISDAALTAPSTSWAEARYVYWTRQDGMAFDGRGNLASSGMFLGCGDVIPREVVDMLRATGLPAARDGDERRRTWVRPAPEAA